MGKKIHNLFPTLYGVFNIQSTNQSKEKQIFAWIMSVDCNEVSGTQLVNYHAKMKEQKVVAIIINFKKLLHSHQKSIIIQDHF